MKKLLKKYFFFLFEGKKDCQLNSLFCCCGVFYQYFTKQENYKLEKIANKVRFISIQHLSVYIQRVFHRQMYGQIK